MNSEFKISSGNFSNTLSLETDENGIIYLKLKFHSENPEIPSNFSVQFFMPYIDIYSLWTPLTETPRVISPEGFWVKEHSGIAHRAPILSVISKSGKNRMTIAVSDVKIASAIKLRLYESKKEILVDTVLFTEVTNPITDYEVTIRIDNRDINYEDALYNVSKWWEAEYKPCFVPEAAKMPMFSTWYNYHQHLNDDELLKQCETAVKFGMKTIIIDDGWQTDDSRGGYAYCGDWNVSKSKIRDMEKLVGEIHKIGMEVILWYSVPFVGVNSENFKKFEGKYLNKPVECGILDPRFPECRKFSVELYKNAVLNWQLDGLKLDFIDSFKLTEYSSKEYEAMDYISLEDAIEALLKEINSELKKINPDFMIEFRQKYIGPAVRQVGNMLRVNDCPCSSEQNKIGIADIRFLAGNTAVHADMIMWNNNDTVESAAYQMISTIYGVPQISVKLDKITAQQKKMLEFYLKFWIENKKVLLEGKMTAENPENGYSVIKSQLGREAVITSYSKNDIDISSLANGKIINASGSKYIIVTIDKPVKFTVLDCMGNIVSADTLSNGIFKLFVPECGIINFFERKIKNEK